MSATCRHPLATVLLLQCRGLTPGHTPPSPPPAHCECARRFLGNLQMRLLFDWPLVTAAYILREWLGLRAFGEFAHIMRGGDDLDGPHGTLVQGSLPFPSDVKTLAEGKDAEGEPYNVGAVVNMTREWPGPEAEYEKHGVVQLRLPHVDTCMAKADKVRQRSFKGSDHCLSFCFSAFPCGSTALTSDRCNQLEEGAGFIKEQLLKFGHTCLDPPRPCDCTGKKRVFVHCKGGIARASTMSLAHYIINKNKEATKAAGCMKGQRKQVEAKVCKYNSIKELQRKFQDDTDVKLEVPWRSSLMLCLPYREVWETIPLLTVNTAVVVCLVALPFLPARVVEVLVANE
eukprot:SAG22_NODE_1748_length_3664_cov_10.806171_2_plen_343_part_00